MFGRVGPWEIALMLLILPSLAVYFVPTIVAIVRHARNVLGIVLNHISPDTYTTYYPYHYRYKYYYNEPPPNQGASAKEKPK